jgi:hypothetical protein
MVFTSRHVVADAALREHLMALLSYQIKKSRDMCPKIAAAKSARKAPQGKERH